MDSIQDEIDFTGEILFETLKDFIDDHPDMNCDPPTAHRIGVYDLYIYDNAGNEYNIIDFYIEIVCDFVKSESSQLTIVFTDYKKFRHIYPRDPSNTRFTLNYLKGDVKTKAFTNDTNMMDFLFERKAKLKPKIIYSILPNDASELMFTHVSDAAQLYELITQSRVDTDVMHTGLFNNVYAIEHNLDMYVGTRGINPYLGFFDRPVFLPVPDDYNSLIDITSMVGQEVTSMDQYFSTLDLAEQSRIDSIRKRYSVIRSTIDFLHDFVGLAVQIKDQFIAFISTYIGREFIPDVTSIFAEVTTSGGNVSQTACKNLWSKYAINYRQELAIPFFPISEMGNLGSAKIFKDEDRLEFTDEFNDICNTLRKMNVTHFYIEAQNTPLATAMVRQGFNIVIDSAAARDAAPGYSIKTFVKEAIQYKRQSYSSFTVNREYNPELPNNMPVIRQDNASQITIVNGPNSLISKYLLANGIFHLVKADSNDNTIYSGITSDNVPLISVTKSGKKVQELGLNALLETAGFQQLRGSQNASRISDISILGSKPNESRMLMLFLKTYTDYCQADTIEQIKVGLRVIAASSDFLASRTFDAFFSTPTFYVGVNNVTTTCSDTRYMIPTQSEIENKLLVYAKIISNPAIIVAYINYYITRIQTYIAVEYASTLSPAVYYAGTSLQLWLEQVKINAAQTIQAIIGTNVAEMDNNERISFIQQFPEKLSEYIMSLSKVNQLSQHFMETHNKSSEIIISIMAINNRITVDELIDNFYKTKQSLINALPNDTPEHVINTHLISIYTSAIATKSNHAVKSFLTNILAILLNPLLPLEVKEIFKQIFVMVSFVNSLNLQIKPKLNERIKKQFIAVNPNTFSAQEVLSGITDDNLGPIENIPIPINGGIKVSDFIQNPEDVEIYPSTAQEHVDSAISDAVAQAQIHNNAVINYAKKQLTSDILELQESQSQFVNDKDSLPLVFSYIDLVSICENISNIAPGFSERIEEYITETSKLPPLDRKVLDPIVLVVDKAVEHYMDIILKKMETALLRGGKRKKNVKKTCKGFIKKHNNKAGSKKHNLNTKKTTKRSRKTRKITKRAKYIKKNVTKHRR